MSIETRSRQYGKVFDHWQIREFLGSGSGGKTAVFRMTRVDSDRGASALKVVNLIEERGSFQELSEFRKKEYESARVECSRNAEREVWLMDELRGNTNIVDYLDHTFVDWADDSGFGRDLLIRMELLKDLRSDLRSGRIFSEEEVLKVGRDICTALILCHRKNILHRDVKPENIFCNKDGNYKLGDFGVSRVLDSCPGAVASTGIGTYEYWPAEQMTGRYDTRVDTYSLGLVLYELSNRNRLPFAASAYATSREVSLRLSGTELPAPCDASPALARVILKACAFDPKDRFPNAEALLRALHHVSTQGSGQKKAPEPPKTYSTAMASRPAAGSDARRAVMEVLAEDEPGRKPVAPARKKGKGLLWAAIVLLALGIAAAGWTMASRISGGTPDAQLPEEPAQMQTISSEEPAAETAPPETAAPETTQPVQTETVPESEPVETAPKEQAVQMAEAEDTPVIGIVNSLDNGVNIRSDPGLSAPIVGKYKTGTYIEFLETMDTDDVSWGRTEDGWVCMDYVFQLREQANGEPKPIIGRVTTLDTGVNIRSDPGINTAILGEYKAGTNIEILEVTDMDGTGWGRTEDGWVCLYYVCLLRERAEHEQIPIIGRVNSRSTHVNIRQEPTSTSKALGDYPVGTMLELWEITQVNGIQWGRTEDGWVCMTYVTMIPEQEEGEEPILYTGWVILTTELNVRQSPSMQAGILKRLLRGECVNIYETCAADGKRWGRCDDGWIDLYHTDLLPVDLEYNDVRIVNTDNAPVYSEPDKLVQVASCEKLEMILIYEYRGYGNNTMCRTDQGWIPEECFY